MVCSAHADTYTIVSILTSKSDGNSFKKNLWSGQGNRQTHIRFYTDKHTRAQTQAHTHCPHLTIFSMEHIAGGQESRRWHKQTINIYSGNIIWISWAYISIKLTFEYVDEHKSRLCIRWYTSVISRMLTVRSLNGQLRIVIVWNWFFKQ